MIFELITIAVVGAIVLFAGYTTLQFLGKFPRRTIEDVTPYLRPAEFEELESLLDPAHEVNFRLHLSPAEFQDWQRKRIHLLREYLLRMSHNSLVLIEWGNLEFDANGSPARKSEDMQARAQELVQAATEFRLYALLALTKLKFWIVFRLDGSASLPRLRNVLGIDALAAYKRLKGAAGTLGMVYGNEHHQQLLARL